MYVNNYNITADEYLALYEKYLTRSPDDLLLIAGPIQDKRVLDLCAGTLRAANRAKDLGAKFVIALDKSRDIIPKQHKADRVVICDVNQLYYLKCRDQEDNLFVNKVDLIVCQQAINYWFNDDNIQNISLLLKDGGHFVFNTFNTKPSKEPTIRQYNMASSGAEFTEVIQLVNDTVYHLQMRKDYAPHFTSFRYINETDIYNTVSKYFKNVSSIIEGPTTIYKCER